MTFQLTDTDIELVKVFFNEKFYLENNQDIVKAKMNGFQHFLKYGLVEGRNPSQIFDLAYVKHIASQAETWPLETPEDIVTLLREWPVDSLFGPSALVCPAWLALQASAVENISLAELLDMTIPTGLFTFHPGMLPCEIPKAIKISALIQQFEGADFAEMSLFDLDVHATNHRDLRQFRSTPQKIFNHFWSYGVFEYRLGYLGGHNLINEPKEVRFFDQCATIYRNYFYNSGLVATQSATSLQPRNLEYLNLGSSASSDAKHLLCESYCATVDNWKLSHLNFLKDRIYSSSVIVLPHDASLINAERTRTSDVGSQILTDQDLLSGAHRVTTRRVVYAVNIGSYDDPPIPPQMDDCSYFLITDAAEISADTPWTIVSPTLHEVDIKRQCLWYKTHPHLLFPDTKFVTWMDGNVDCRTLSGEILISHENLSELATFVHPNRNCVYDEAAIIIELKLDKKETVERVVKNSQSEGFPEHYGLFETNVLFSQAHDSGVRRFFDTWWRNICLGSRRDQMSFTFSAWKEGIEISSLHSRSSTKNSRYFTKRAHKTKKGRFA